MTLDERRDVFIKDIAKSLRLPQNVVAVVYIELINHGLIDYDTEKEHLEEYCYGSPIH